ncbi:hypothetical protein HNP38_002745 [Chryseobacterium defluvii]|uniref:Uncharacterized protein n=1 Tax=Chryseobacterium defluvii TaxID=160396 RepID=A0A840KD63_9FLAO|nr:hypothetical protein [Chryseobacterium defluvii]
METIDLLEILFVVVILMAPIINKSFRKEKNK